MSINNLKTQRMSNSKKRMPKASISPVKKLTKEEIIESVINFYKTNTDNTEINQAYTGYGNSVLSCIE
jgi:hypothetical protein